MRKLEIYQNKCTTMLGNCKKSAQTLSFTLFLLLSGNSAYAQAAIPWQTPFQNLIQWMSDDTAKWVITLVIVGAGLSFAIGETGGFFRRCSGAVLGGAIAVQAATWSGALFGW